jgi:hypothetical protein
MFSLCDIYTLSQEQQQRLKQSIAGKPKQEALLLLSHLPGIQSASIAGIDETSNLPKRDDLIHFMFVSKG